MLHFVFFWGVKLYLQPVNFYGFFVPNTNQAVNLQNVSVLFSDKQQDTPAAPPAALGAPPPTQQHAPAADAVVEVHRAEDGSYPLEETPAVEAEEEVTTEDTEEALEGNEEEDDDEDEEEGDGGDADYDPELDEVLQDALERSNRRAKVRGKKTSQAVNFSFGFSKRLILQKSFYFQNIASPKLETLAAKRTKRNLAAVNYADMELTEEEQQKGTNFPSG